MKEPELDLNSRTNEPSTRNQNPIIVKSVASPVTSYVITTVLLTILGSFGGFTFGTKYGEKTAIYSNEQLRSHYAGRCYEVVNGQLSEIKTMLTETHANQTENPKELEAKESLVLNIKQLLENTSQTVLANNSLLRSLNKPNNK